jgi:phosphoribosyl-AMP cyclohydrolase
MAGTAAQPFAQRGTSAEIEAGLTFMPKFDAAGLIPAIATDADTGAVLMLAWMNAEALQRTLETAQAHFFSRSRGRLWRKGEESGNTMRVTEVRTDCDQDAIWLRVRLQGDGAACHTGRNSCFYRRVPLGKATAPLEPADR